MTDADLDLLSSYVLYINGFDCKVSGFECKVSGFLTLGLGVLDTYTKMEH